MITVYIYMCVYLCVETKLKQMYGIHIWIIVNMIESYRMWRIVTHWSLLFICWKNSIAPRSKPSCSCFSQGEALRTSAEAPPAECAFRKTRPFDHGSMMIIQHDSDTSMIHWYIMIVYIYITICIFVVLYV